MLPASSAAAKRRFMSYDFPARFFSAALRRGVCPTKLQRREAFLSLFRPQDTPPLAAGRNAAYETMALSERSESKGFLRRMPHRLRCGHSLPATEPHRRSRGVTLIELLVTISLIIIFSGIVVVSYRSAPRNEQLERNANALALDIRRMQSAAFAIRAEEGAVPRGGYGVFFDNVSGTAYTLFRDQDGNQRYDASEVIETKSLERGVRFGGFSAGGETITEKIVVLFCPPYGTTLLYVNTDARGSGPCIGNQETLQDLVTVSLTHIKARGTPPERAKRHVRTYSSGSVQVLSDVQLLSYASPEPPPAYEIPPPPN